MDGHIKSHKLLHLGATEAEHVGKVRTIIKGIMHGYYLAVLVYSSTNKTKSFIKLYGPTGVEIQKENFLQPSFREKGQPKEHKRD